MAGSAALARRLLRARSALSHAWVASASLAVGPPRPSEFALTAINGARDECCTTLTRSHADVDVTVLSNRPRIQQDSTNNADWRVALWQGTWDDPVPIASSIGATERIVACSGRHPNGHHPTLYMVVKAGEPRACEHPDCGQVFKLTTQVDRDYAGSI